MITGQPQHSNRLIHESSPYLRQHAHNPVDWFAWGEEAFDLARKENKPVLLSIGYSACHWCHVMAHESFEDEAIAAAMNAGFVNIKVDLEERPDLDQIYQNAVQIFIRRGGGWPLTMFLTPDRVPFYGGTYFPPNDRFGLPGFPKILDRLATAYRERPDDITRTASDVIDALTRRSATRLGTSGEVDPDLLARSAAQLAQIFDSIHGGFGNAPKFPSTPALHLLLRHFHQGGRADDLTRVTQTLGKMAWGGIYDQIGGGFHRYSTDRIWLVPHFEKMLYDNAQLAPLYFAAGQATGHRGYRAIGCEILDYVLREMTAPEGGFYATQDADTDGHEGTTYVWTAAEIGAVLGDEDGAVVCQHYGVTAAGNFEGKNILNVSRPVEALAKEIGMTPEKMGEILRAARPALLAERMKRPQPFRDEKVLTAWNGLMIRAFVEGYNVTREARYLAAAERAVTFVFENLYRDGKMLRVWKDGVAKLNGYLDDTAFLLEAVIALYEATGTGTYLQNARDLAAALCARFEDDAAGGFFFTSSDHEALLSREKPVYDQSIPSGNAVAAHALLRLFYLTGEASYRASVERTLSAAAEVMRDNPSACGNLIAVADFYLRGADQIVLIGDPDTSATQGLLGEIHQLYLPNKVVHLVHPQETSSIPTPAQGKSMINGQPTIYLCRGTTCLPPITDGAQLKAALQTRSFDAPL